VENELTYPHYPLELIPAPCQRLIDLVAKHTDAPLPLIVGAMLAVLSLLAGTSVRIDGGVILNEFYALIAGTGVRKSTAARFVVKLINLLLTIDPPAQLDGRVILPPDISYLSGFSIEGVEDELTEYKNLLVVAGEYKVVFAKAHRQTQKNTIPQLTEMYDCDPIKCRTREKKGKELSDYSFSLLATSTPEWFSEGLSKENVLGGFLNRHISILVPMPDEVLAIRSDFDQEDLLDLARDLLALDRSPRTIRIVGKAEMQFYTDYINEHWRRMKRATEAERGVMVRETAHSLKLAGLKAFSEGRGEIDLECLIFGESWARASTEALLTCTKESPKAAGVPKTDEQRLLSYISSKYSKTGIPISRRERAKYFGGKVAPWEIATQNLIAGGLIVETPEGFILAPSAESEEIDGTASPSRLGGSPLSRVRTSSEP
jgi:hypothetical protein